MIYAYYLFSSKENNRILIKKLMRYFVREHIFCLFSLFIRNAAEIIHFLIKCTFLNKHHLYIFLVIPGD